ncbi:MAG: transcriptional repressor [Syntrophaceae bacterium]|nr:transcriptional repressor [Syntrophaceae bacterium]
MYARNPEIRVEEMLAKLKERDFRITPQRLAILKILAESKGHPSVDDIYQTVKVEFPTTSVATVYKTVSLLKELNEVLELSFPDGSNRYDGNNPSPHPHAICVKCRKIMDPELMNIDPLVEEISRKTGYKIYYEELEFFGLCPECQKQN